MKESNKETKKQLRENLKATREKMKEAFKNDKSESELRSIHTKMKVYRSQMEDLRFEKLLQIRTLLTPEQRKKFQELKEKHRGKRKGKRGKRGGRGKHGNDKDSDDD